MSRSRIRESRSNGKNNFDQLSSIGNRPLRASRPRFLRNTRPKGSNPRVRVSEMIVVHIKKKKIPSLSPLSLKQFRDPPLVAC